MENKVNAATFELPVFLCFISAGTCNRPRWWVQACLKRHRDALLIDGLSAAGNAQRVAFTSMMVGRSNNF